MLASGKVAEDCDLLDDAVKQAVASINPHPVDLAPESLPKLSVVEPNKFSAPDSAAMDLLNKAYIERERTYPDSQNQYQFRKYEPIKDFETFKHDAGQFAGYFFNNAGPPSNYYSRMAIRRAIVGPF